MSIEDDIRREFRYQSEHEKRAIKSSWESFLEFAARVIRVTADILDALLRLYVVIRGSW
jgi:hypothetical protein